MSIRGVTFDNQEVAASDHGTLYKNILNTDGIISGCAVTFSGSVATIAAGYLMVAGRLIQLTVAETLTVAASGNYARIIVNIDTSQTATTSSFEQVSFSVDYAASPDGFSPLTQQDINAGGGNTYQAALAILTLSGANITAIYEGPYASGVSALSAQILATPRNIGNAAFDGSSDISLAQMGAASTDASSITGAASTLAAFTARRIYISDSPPTADDGAQGDLWVVV